MFGDYLQIQSHYEGWQKTINSYKQNKVDFHNSDVRPLNNMPYIFITEDRHLFKVIH